jgi:hypothetical protein
MSVSHRTEVRCPPRQLVVGLLCSPGGPVHHRSGPVTCHVIEPLELVVAAGPVHR